MSGSVEGSCRYRVSCYHYAEKLFRKLIDLAEKRPCDCIALSGGIDTSIILLAAVERGLRPRGYVVFYEKSVPRDLFYSNYLSKIYGIELVYVMISERDIDYLRRRVIECIGREKIDSHGDGGCVEIRNDIVFYSVLERATRDNCECIYTGSGGDELFAGYSFMNNLTSTELERSIEKMVKGRFPEIEIARCINAPIEPLFLRREFIEEAIKTPIECLRRQDLRGKEILREILRSRGLHMISERTKTPAESGAGTIAICRSVYDE